jgi:choline dehydrogenase
MAKASVNESQLLKTYDVIVCGAGCSGSVVARRLSDNPNIRVLLIEAGGDDQRPSVQNASRWFENLGGDTDWSFRAEANPLINSRSIPQSMGKVLGGGSSINAMIWARGHKRDWDYFAKASGDPAWGYDSVLDIYRRIEDWRGTPDQRRGVSGIVTVTQSATPSPLAAALLEAAHAIGIPTFDSPNGAMMEAKAGAARADLRLENGRRLSVFGSYVRPVLYRPNLTVLTAAHVLRVLFDRRRATGVEVITHGERHVVHASAQVVLSLGAINTPHILMLSGIGDRRMLAEHNIEVVHYLPGVGADLQDHTNFPVVWEHSASIAPRDSGTEAMLYVASPEARDGPDILMCQAEFPFCSPEAGRHGIPKHGWSLVAALAQPRSRGCVLLRSADPLDKPIIDLNVLSHPEDIRLAKTAVELSRQIGAAKSFARLETREAVPGSSCPWDADTFIKDSALSFWHQSCTARMGLDSDAVVGANLKVHGLTNLTIADASIMPRITSGNTMAPCVIIGERAADILTAELT